MPSARIPGERLRIAAVGVGWVSQNRHLPAILRSRELELIGVIDPDEQAARAVARRFGTRHAATSRIGEVPWLNNVEAVVIGTPPFAHAGVISQAIDCGLHVLCEKPFVVDSEEGERLAAAALERSLALCVIHNFQFTRAFSKLQRDLATGRLGAVRSLTALQLSNPRRRLPAWYHQLTGGLFFDESPHLFYLARRLLPGVALAHVQVTASTSGISTPAEIYAQLRNARGQKATLLMNFEAALSEWHVMVTGEHGTADIDMFRDIYTFIPDDGRHGPRDILRNGLRAVSGHLRGTFASGLLLARHKLTYGYDEVLRRFASAVRRADLQPEYIGSAEGLAVLRLQQQVLGSGMQGAATAGQGRPVSWTPDGVAAERQPVHWRLPDNAAASAHADLG